MKSSFFLTIFLLFLLNQTTLAISCMDGYYLILGPRCIKMMPYYETRVSATRQCNLLGGNLVTAYDQHINNLIKQISIDNNAPIWLGLKPFYDTRWVWDDGDWLYWSDFDENMPKPKTNAGQCVYMQKENNNTWLTSDCTSTKAMYICETDVIGTCKYQNDENCFYPIGELTKDEAQLACSNYCGGNLVSIHNLNDNSAVLNIYQQFVGTIPYSRIGAQLSTNNVNSWIDNSTWNFSNIGDQDINKGLCFSMALTNREIDSGKWVSSDCNSIQPSVCKRPLNSSCTPQPLEKFECSSTISGYQEGQVYSPNYPSPYCTNNARTCFYSLVGQKNTTMSVRFPVFGLDPDSIIRLYYSYNNQDQFAEIMKSNFSGNWYTSPTNIIRLIFYDRTFDCNNTQNIFSWQAQFSQSYPNNCDDSAEHLTPGVFTSPNYPDLYPKSASCTHLIRSSTNSRVQIVFDDYSLASGDYVYIYEGNSNKKLLATLWGTGTNATFVTTISSSMYLQFSSRGSSSPSSGFHSYYQDFP